MSLRRHNLEAKILVTYQQISIITISESCWKISRENTPYKPQLTGTKLCSLSATPGWMLLRVMHGLLRTMTLLCWEMHVFDCGYDQYKYTQCTWEIDRVWHKSEVVDCNCIININAIAVLPKQYRTFTVQWCWEYEETSPYRPQRLVGLVIVLSYSRTLTNASFCIVTQELCTYIRVYETKCKPLGSGGTRYILPRFSSF
jgi:hypothetical protein